MGLNPKSNSLNQTNLDVDENQPDKVSIPDSIRAKRGHRKKISVKERQEREK